MVTPMAAPEHIPCELVLDARAPLGEGPVWDAENQALLWVDIDNHDSGTVTFQTASINASTGTAQGLRVANSNGGTIAV